jgi:hydrogenase expression/formation protein HypE
MRDPTRGGLATTLNEISMNQNFGITIYEENIPIKEEVRAVSELLGLDPLYIANEGKAIIICDPSSEDKILSIIKNHEYGKDARVIGEVINDYPGKVLMRTMYGVNRFLEMLSGEQMPRIC